MGVQGLWQLLEPSGKPVSLESLQGKVLAVDVSMWLHQSMKGMRDQHGNAVQNAHLQFLFSRICKLLFYKIKPVFVFDGGVPSLKKQTLAKRKQRQVEASFKKETTAKKLIKNMLEHHAVNTVLGNDTSNHQTKPHAVTKERDLFELNPLPEADYPEEPDSSDWIEERMEHANHILNVYQNLEDIDIESEDFKNLPADVRYEILSDLKESRKLNSWVRTETLPEDAKDFSNYQVSKLLKQSKLSGKIDCVRKELNTETAGDITSALLDDKYASEVISSKIASDDNTHFILVKGLSQLPKSMKEVPEGYEASTSSSDLNCSVLDHSKGIVAVDNQNDANLSPESVYIDHSPEHAVDICLKSPVAPAMETNVDYSKEGGFIKEDDDDDCCNLKDIEISNNQNISSNIQQNSVNTSVENDRDEVAIGITDTSENKQQVVHVSEAENSGADNVQCIDISREDMITQKSVEEVNSITFPGDSSLQNNVKNEMNSESESDDGDFIEVTIDPSNIPVDNLFPLSIFNTTSDEPANEKNETSAIQLNTQPSDTSPISISPSEIEQPKSVDHSITQEDLTDMKYKLEEETVSLIAEKGKQERLATSITDQLQKEAQELLLLFGIPYIIAPMEAEAQCAHLDLTDQTNGTITDDSDVWLFGGKRVYRNFFNRNKEVEFFDYCQIEKNLLIDRIKLINIAYLCGCDYTSGIPGIGPVTAMEILLEFDGDNIDGLKKLKSWWDEFHDVKIKHATDTKLKQKLKSFELGEGFPNESVFEAFMNPEVDESMEKFQWGRPDVDLLRDFALEKLHWKKDKIDETLLPCIKKLNEKDNQMQIVNFFNRQVQDNSPVKSKRVKRVLTRIKDSKSGKGKSSAKFPAKKSKLSINGSQGGGYFGRSTVSSNTGINLSESSSDSDSNL